MVRTKKPPVERTMGGNLDFVVWATPILEEGLLDSDYRLCLTSVNYYFVVSHRDITRQVIGCEAK